MIMEDPGSSHIVDILIKLYYWDKTPADSIWPIQLAEGPYEDFIPKFYFSFCDCKVLLLFLLKRRFYVIVLTKNLFCGEYFTVRRVYVLLSAVGTHLLVFLRLKFCYFKNMREIYFLSTSFFEKNLLSLHILGDDWRFFLGKVEFMS